MRISKYLRELRIAGRALGTAIFDRIFLFFVSIPPGAPKILIISVDAIGDFVLRLESVKRLTLHYRALGLQVVLLANVLWSSWARQLAVVDEVWELQPDRFHRDFAYRIQWLRRVRAAGFSHVVELAHSRRITVGDSLVRASGAPERIGSEGDCANTQCWLKRWSDRWYTKLFPCGTEQRMELLRNADLMRGMGFSDFQAVVPELKGSDGDLPTSLADAAFAVLVPGAGWIHRAWPVSAFAEIGRRLIAQGLRLAVVGVASERPIADALLRELDGQAEDLVGRTTMPQLVTTLQRAQLVVANETGPAHIAAAVGTPVVCIVGGGHYGRFMPYQVDEQRSDRPLPFVLSQDMDCFGCNWECIFPLQPGTPVPCVSNVAVDTVWRQACTARR